MEIKNLDDARQILLNFGYTVKNDKNGIRANSLHRGGDNITSLLIYKNLTYFDFATNESGKFEDLIKINNGEIINIKRPKFEEKEEVEKKFDSSLLNDLVPNYSFFEKRGISIETLKLFGGGWCHAGSLNRRYVFPIFDLNNNIIGFSGRTTRKDYKENNIAKWKIIGRKSNFIYPCHVNNLDFSKKVIIVESIGDVLALYELGIRNAFCIFGLKISQKLIDFICSKNINNIILSTNNDILDNNSSDGINRGSEAAEKIYRQLIKIFDDVKIKLPPNELECKDWGDAIIKYPNYDAKKYFGI